jgi:spermidine/putrescine transport system ATP-binding protein
MQTQLKDLQRSVGVTFCYVTHDQGEAFSMSDRVAVMNHGLLEQVGTPEEIYHRPASSFVAEFVGTANRFAGRVEGVRADRYSVAIDGVGLRTAGGPAGLTAGTPVQVLVRPENLQLDGVPDEGGTDLDAQVVDTAFLGAERTVRLHSARLGELTATARGSGRAPEPGSRVRLSWSDDDAWLIPAAGPRAAAPH